MYLVHICALSKLLGEAVNEDSICPHSVFYVMNRQHVEQSSETDAMAGWDHYTDVPLKVPFENGTS